MGITACLFIEGSSGWSPSEKLDILLSSDVTNLDSLYMKILQRTFPSGAPAIQKRIRNILGTVITAQEPLPLSALFIFCSGTKPDAIRSVLQPLGSLLSGVSHDDIPVRPLHSSFRDFLIDDARSGQFYVDLDEHNENLLMGSLKAMRGLYFNICGLKTSHLNNEHQEDLEVAIKENISVSLSYACRYWAVHLEDSEFSKEILKELRAFMHTRLLYWFEVLSLLGSFKVAYKALPMIDMWCEVRPFYIPKYVSLDIDYFWL